MASALFVFQAAAATTTEGVQNHDCLECHAEESLTKTTPDGKEVPVFVDPKLFNLSVHSALNCVDCHADLTPKHPDDNQPAQPVSCADCHADETSEYAGSIHGVSHTMGCNTCETAFSG